MDGNTAFSKRLEKVHELIRDKKAPNYIQIGKEIGCCEHTAEKFINDLRTKLQPYGIFIVFDKQANSYVYTQAGRCINVFLWIPAELEELFQKHFASTTIPNPPQAKT